MLATISPDLRISYDEAGSGPPLVLLHAFPQARAMWKRQLEALSSDFRVLCPDLPGFGESRSSSACTIEGMADDIAAWLKYLRIEKAIIGGVSMGGYVALARRHPQVLAGLILASTRADADSEEARLNREKMIEFARQNEVRAVFEKMAPRLFASSAPPELVREAALIAEPIPREAIVATLEALRDRPDARPELASIEAPTLILVGEEDGVSPLDCAHEMASGIPNTQLQVFAAAGHFAHLEAPAAWSRAVREFFASEAASR